MNDDRSTPRGLQFGLQHLLVAMVLLSVAFAVLFAPPNWMASTAAIIMSTLVASTLAAAGLTAAFIYGRGDVRAFCIGALFPIVVAAFPTVVLLAVAAFNGSDKLDEYASGMRTVAAVAATVSFVAGVLSVIVRRRLSRDG